MEQLTNKRILLGVTGSIAAYKSAEVVRRLREAGAEIQVVMTRSATEFITPLTLQALSGRPVRQALLDPTAEAAMGHIELARWADAVLVAPAGADFLSRLAQGRADDLLNAVCLACEVPIAVAPAMNRGMWADPATRANCARLRERGVILFGPDVGDQACGESGAGRMLEPEVLAKLTAELFTSGQLAGLRVLITAGPTREAIDPVRYISNRSSGRMGFALARAAREAGARVTLVTGPVSLSAPERVERIDVTDAEEMLEAVLGNCQDADILIAAAAVADFRPLQVSGYKMKKSAQRMVLELEQTPDILARAAAVPRPPFMVGFAAETERLKENAIAKLYSKSLDMIIANRVGVDAAGAGFGFESEENEVSVFWEGGEAAFPRTTKDRLARQIIDLVAVKYHEKVYTTESA